MMTSLPPCGRALDGGVEAKAKDQGVPAAVVPQAAEATQRQPGDRLRPDKPEDRAIL